MARRVFRSKVDRWLWLMMLAAVLGMGIAMFAVAISGEDPIVVVALILMFLLTGALIASVMFGTSYTVDRKMLHIRSGPFRWKVALDEITSVEATRNPLSSPALSLDRLRIRYGKRRQVIVSPADRDGFLKAIGRELDT
jgi:hypothetical protein